MVHSRKHIVIFSRMHFVTFVYIYNMHQDSNAARLIAVCKRTLMLLWCMVPRQRQMSLMKNVNAILHHSQATSKRKRIWNIHFPIYCSGTPTWLCARVEPAQNRYSTRSPTPCRRLLMFASSYFWPPPSSYSKCAWKVFYDILKMLVLFLRRKTVRC